MNYLSVDGLTKNYGEKILFKDLHFGLSKGDKVALIANNGVGKSTLLKIITGQDTPDSGKVSVRHGIRMGFLHQEPNFSMHETINDLINGANSKLLAAIREYEDSLEAQGIDYNDETHKRFELASNKMEELQAWDYERRLTTILSKFNITDLDQTIDSLSGGQKKRLALALVLLDNPEMIILDEPTNHLDLDMIEWLEEFLTQSTLTLLMVTHDRYFLDRVCNKILELTDGKLYKHEGNYSYFLQKRDEREENYDVEAGKAKQLMKKELEWMRKMPKARGTKSKSRIDAFYDIKDKAMSRKKKQELKLEVRMSRIGGNILDLKKVRKSYGDKLILDGFEYSFKKGERIGIIGKNGVGKTTFLNIITGNEQPDSGKVNLGDTIVYGYYSQAGITLKDDKRVIEVVKDIADVIILGDGSSLPASQFLTHFMFPPEMQYTYVSKLSGGERRRLYLLTVLIKNPNFLILDEPTNDLDLLTLNKLEEFLAGFGGCLIVVSHDRYFMDKLVDHLFIFEGDGIIRDYNGTYSEYREEEDEKEMLEEEARKELKSKDKAASAVMDVPAPVAEKKKLSFKEKHEYETLEKDIAELETEKAELESKLSDASHSHDEIMKMALRFEEVKTQLDEKGLRWLELGEIVA
jgi:ATP-binding cassette subfamily F protein uup